MFSRAPAPQSGFVRWFVCRHAVGTAPIAVARSPSSPGGSHGTTRRGRVRAGNSCRAPGRAGWRSSGQSSRGWTSTSCRTSPASSPCSDQPGTSLPTLPTGSRTPLPTRPTPLSRRPRGTARSQPEGLDVRRPSSAAGPFCAAGTSAADTATPRLRLTGHAQATTGPRPPPLLASRANSTGPRPGLELGLLSSPPPTSPPRTPAPTR